MRREAATAWIALLIAGLFFAGCTLRLEKPPIEITYRESLLGAGKILRLKNQSNVAIYELRVEIQSPKGEVVYEEPELAAYETLEVGWKRLGGFEIPEDAEIEVRARDYFLPLKATLTPETRESGAG